MITLSARVREATAGTSLNMERGCIWIKHHAWNYNFKKLYWTTSTFLGELLSLELFQQRQDDETSWLGEWSEKKPNVIALLN